MAGSRRSEEHTSELQSHSDLVCRLLLEKKKHSYQMGKPASRRPSSRHCEAELTRSHSGGNAACIALYERKRGPDQVLAFFFLKVRPPPESTLFPQPPPFRF